MTLGVLKPFDEVEKRLDTFSPLSHCCCLCCKCSLDCGLKWALGLLMLEAVGHLVLSGARPRWEWNSNGITTFAFAMQIVMRIILIPLIPFAWWAIPKGRSTLWVIRVFFRAMLVVCFLRLLELILSFVEVPPFHKPTAVSARTAGSVILSYCARCVPYAFTPTFKSCESSVAT
jgi:hypothetical protein